ncbi:MAG: YmdB family metallophosphoesterase [Clostridia bacterium]|nr:YmdB family metallophosphoesterase [Clostridia bacterium]
MKILCLGDIVGPAAVDRLCKTLYQVRKERKIDFVMLNGENADVGNGLSKDTAERLLAAGVDVITGGNHIFQKRDIYHFLDDEERILRPANYPDAVAGKGYAILDVCGWRILVINVQGTVFMDAIDCPFRTVEKILERCKGKFDLSLMDIHAEATSEKIALARYFDGKIDMIVGTHTHVPTADARILPAGSGYVTDLGMCGVTESALGVDVNCIIRKLRYKIPTKFELAAGNVTFQGVEFGKTPQKAGVDFVARVEFE